MIKRIVHYIITIMMRRLKNEFEKNDDLSQYEFNKITNELTFIYKNKSHVKLKLKTYPFSPPKNLHINNKIINYMNLGNKPMLKKYFNVYCLCCISITCPNNWSCMKSINDIMKEYISYKTLINTSMVFYYLEKKTIIPDEIIEIIAQFCGNKIKY